MRKLIKLNVILLVFTVFFGSFATAEQILPLAKPKVDEEIKAKTAKKK